MDGQLGPPPPVRGLTDSSRGGKEFDLCRPCLLADQAQGSSRNDFLAGIRLLGSAVGPPPPVRGLTDSSPGGKEFGACWLWFWAGCGRG